MSGHKGINYAAKGIAGTPKYLKCQFSNLSSRILKTRGLLEH